MAAMVEARALPDRLPAFGGAAATHAGPVAGRVAAGASLRGQRLGPWLLISLSAVLIIIAASAAVIQARSVLAQFRASDAMIVAMDKAVRSQNLASSMARISAANGVGTASGQAATILDPAALSQLAVSAGLPAAETALLQQQLAQDGTTTLDALADQIGRQATQTRLASDNAAAVHSRLSKRAYVTLLTTSSLALLFFVCSGMLLVGYAFERADVDRKLGLARQSVMRAERDRAGILAVAGHDLRQPLQAINLFASTIAHNSAEENTQALLKKIGAAAQSMQRMIDGLLDLAKLDAGLVAADFVEVRLADILDGLRDEFAQLAAAKGLAFSLPRTSAIVHTDPLLVETIMRNLLGNAVKFCVEGSVRVTVQVAGTDVVVAVTDTGPGIASHELTTVFQDFYRSQRTGGGLGLGLGLGIVRRLAGLLQTSVTVNSVLDEGSTFRLSLPGVAGAAAEAPVRRALPPAGLALLLVEDDGLIRDAMAGQLRAWGMTVAVARSGEEASRLLQDQAGQRIDVALVDYDLGDMTGISLLHAITASYPDAKGIVITGSPDYDVLRRRFEGPYVWLRKPVDAAVLFDAVTSVAEAVLPVSRS